MKKLCVFISALCMFLTYGNAQNSSPYWSLAGNSNALTTSKLGTVNSIPLRIMTKNREWIRVDTLGRVGIGTTNPSQKLYVSGNTVITGNLGLGIAPTQKLHVSGNGIFTGRVGIGTTAPAFSLDVRSTAVFGQFKSSAGYAGVILDKSAANQNEYVIHRTAGTDRWTEGTMGDDNFSLRNWSLGTNALTVDISNNNVGIGAVSSGAKLNVIGSTTAGNGLNVSGYSNGLSANANSTYGTGVSASTDQGYAVFGTSGYLGVYGYAPNGSYGTYGYSNYIGAYGYGTTYGVYGSGATYGVYGSGTSYGVYGSGATGLYASSTTVGGDGVRSSVSGSSNYGVNSYSANSIGVYGATGNSSSYAGYFAGNVYCTGSYLPSDAKLKKNIAGVDNAMDIINRLQPKNYEYRNDENLAKMNLPNGQHYGFIVQDLEKVLPNLVKETSFDFAKTVQQAEAPSIAPLAPPVNGTTLARPQPVQPIIKETKGEKIDFKAINYIELIPIVVKGMQEQDIKMKAQDAEIANLKSEINELKALILKNAGGATTISLSGYLKQNNPNPLNGNTAIKYFVPNDARNAQIVVTDIKGSVLKTYKVPTGEGQLIITKGELASGTYNYTLYVNSNKIDTKQMIVVR